MEAHCTLRVKIHHPAWDLISSGFRRSYLRRVNSRIFNEIDFPRSTWEREHRVYWRKGYFAAENGDLDFRTFSIILEERTFWRCFVLWKSILECRAELFFKIRRNAELQNRRGKEREKGINKNSVFKSPWEKSAKSGWKLLKSRMAKISPLLRAMKTKTQFHRPGAIKPHPPPPVLEKPS